MNYLEEVIWALQYARNVYFPQNKYRRRLANLILAKDIGYAYGKWAPELQTTYSRILVRNSLDQTGDCVDAKEWFDAIREGIKKYQWSVKDADN